MTHRFPRRRSTARRLEVTLTELPGLRLEVALRTRGRTIQEVRGVDLVVAAEDPPVVLEHLALEPGLRVERGATARTVFDLGALPTWWPSLPVAAVAHLDDGARVPSRAWAADVRQVDQVGSAGL